MNARANIRFEDWEAEKMRDPEFRAAAEELEPAYQVARLRIMRGRWPRFMRWGGGGVPWKWSFGWWAGRDGDLHCVVPDLYDPLQSELALSPVCINRAMAILCFVIKRLLLRLDKNLSLRG